jgi:O-antigen/teichoic acid export membrane protein
MLSRSEKWLVAYRAFSDVAGKLAFFLVTVLAARRLSRESFGVFALGTTVGWIAAVASDLGMQMHVARAVARAPLEANRLLRTWLRIRVATALAAFVLIAAGAVLLDVRFAGAIVLFAAVYLVSGIVEFLHHVYRGLSRSDIESTLTIGHRLATLAFAAVALWLLPGTTSLAVAILVPVTLTAIYSTYLAGRLAGFVGAELGSAPGHSESERRGAETSSAPTRHAFLRDVAPIGIGVLLSALYFRIDVFLVQFWRGTDAVALYNAVFRLIDALRLFPAAVLAVALPPMFRAATPRPLVEIGAAVTGFASVAAVALWLAAGWLIPTVYGDGYAAAVPAFRILLAAFPLMSLNYALTHQLIGWNGQRAYAVLCLAALLFNVTLNARLIPALSIEGAAWTTVWTEALLTVGCVVALHRSRRGGAWLRPGTETSSVPTLVAVRAMVERS